MGRIAGQSDKYRIILTMKVSLSVIIPVYNGARWLRPALDSVLNQRFDESLEVIVVDDGSTDGSAAIVDAMRRKHAALKLLLNEHNHGIVRSLNRGLDAAQGRFIARMDADDICLPSRFARQLSFLQAGKADLCGTWFIEFGKGIPRAVRWPNTETALRASMLFQNSICHPSIMARREVFDCYRYRDEYRLAEDYDLFARAMTGSRIANVPEVLLRYRRHAQQATQAQRSPMEAVTRRIRLEVLAAEGITTTEDERRLHNLVRAPHSLTNIDDLLGIEAWLNRLYQLYDDTDAKRVIASQWVRACIRAAPLGSKMLKTYRASKLHGGMRTMIDLSALAAMKLDYGSKAFAVLRRLGLSA